MILLFSRAPPGPAKAIVHSIQASPESKQNLMGSADLRTYIRLVPASRPVLIACNAAP
jgi:hypothetical protein